MKLNKILKSMMILIVGLTFLTGIFAQEVFSKEKPTIQEINNIKNIDNLSRENKAIKNIETIKSDAQNKKEALYKALENKPENVQEINKNQNRVRLAVYNLLNLENFTGNIGLQISQIAKEFNNSIQATINAEERIEKRSEIAKFFAGGNHEDANELKTQVAKNKVKIEELRELVRNCDENCSAEANQMIQEQIDELNKEQVRLSQVAKNELESKGLLGWLWK